MPATPPALEQRLAALAPRVRRLRVARGAAKLALAAVGAAGAVLLLDAALALPAGARGLLLSVWLTGFGLLAWRWLLVPARADLAPADVADELQKYLPELGGRLAAAVSPPPPDQPEAVRSALRDDAARRARAADLDRALPVKPVVAACAAVVLLAFGTAVAVVAAAGERVRRVAAPWHRPAVAPFRVVTSGEQVVRRGGPVTLTAHTEGAAHAHTDAVLIWRDAPGAPESRAAMTPDGAGAFHLTRPAPAGFEYRVEIGPALSDWATVSALDPVELTPESRTEIEGPAYIDGRARTSPGFDDISADEFSVARFHLRFTRPAAAVQLEWRAHDAPKSELVPVEVGADGTSARAALVLRASGVLKLVLVREEGGKKLRTEATANVRVAFDQPPRFQSVAGLTSRPRTARAGAVISIDLVASDDHVIPAVDLVYTLNGGPLVTLPIPRQANRVIPFIGKLDFPLAGKEGDTYRFRVVVSDNRAVGGDNPAGPQTATFPLSGWSEIKLVATAPPLDLQELAAKRDAFLDALATAAREAEAVATELAAVRAASAGTALSGDQRARLNAAAEKLSAATAATRAGCREAAIGLTFRDLAGEARAVTDHQFAPAERLAREAEGMSAAARADALALARVHLTEAQAALTELLERGGKFARAELDRTALRGIARDQRALADAPATVDRLARQNELLARLAAAVADSEPLRLGAAAAQGEELRRAAAALVELGARLRELDAAAKQTAADAREALAAGVARAQEALAARAADVLAGLGTAARLAGVEVPAAADFRRVADLATAGKTVEALAELEKHAQALERVAGAFETWAAERADPRHAARQLALWQDDLAARLRAATKDQPFDKLPDDARAAFRLEQAALRAALDELAFPPESVTFRGNVVVHMKLAADALAGTGAGAQRAMELASAALVRLSERTPTAAERVTKSAREFEKLRGELDATANAVEPLLRAAGAGPPDALAKRLAPHADRQFKLVAQVAGLDLPGHGARLARAVAALRAAVADLRDGSALDALASQAWARREFDRLKLALEGTSPADAKADELARKVAALATALDALGPALTAKHLEPAAPVLAQAVRDLGQLLAPEAPALVNDARAALASAESGTRDAKPDEALRRIRAAADALARLAARLTGAEPDRDRVTRLAALRGRAAERPKELLVSDEAQRQLQREADELTYSRAGFAGQVLKRRALDLYSKLRAKPDPDRLGSDLKALATALDELAAKMADIEELAVCTGGPAAGAPSVADAFLPSAPRARDLRALATAQRAVQGQVARAGADLGARLRPPAVNPYAPLVAKQRALATDALALARRFPTDAAVKAADAALLAADRAAVGQGGAARDAAARAAELFRRIAADGGANPLGKGATDLAARQAALATDFGTIGDDPGAAVAQQAARATELAREADELASLFARKSLIEATKLARAADVGLTDAAAKATAGATGAAEAARAAAEADLRAAAKAVEAVAPPAAAPNADLAGGLTVQRAEVAMRAAARALATDDAAARAAMRAAADALDK
jgi:hypothetical protein